MEPSDMVRSEEGGETTTNLVYEIMRESSTSNWGQGQGRGGHGWISSHQGCVWWVVLFNLPAYTLSIWKFKG